MTSWCHGTHFRGFSITETFYEGEQSNNVILQTVLFEWNYIPSSYLRKEQTLKVISITGFLYFTHRSVFCNTAIRILESVSIFRRRYENIALCSEYCMIINLKDRGVLTM
jgi:hypothetical protein